MYLLCYTTAGDVTRINFLTSKKCYLKARGRLKEFAKTKSGIWDEEKLYLKQFLKFYKISLSMLSNFWRPWDKDKMIIFLTALARDEVRVASTDGFQLCLSTIAVITVKWGNNRYEIVRNYLLYGNYNNVCTTQPLSLPLKIQWP